MAPVTSRRSPDVPDAVGWFAQKLDELGIGDDNYYIHELEGDGMSDLPPMAWLPWSLSASDSCVLSAWLGDYVTAEAQQREREARLPIGAHHPSLCADRPSHTWGSFYGRATVLSGRIYSLARALTHSLTPPS